jgi:hypothetical protein
VGLDVREVAFPEVDPTVEILQAGTSRIKCVLIAVNPYQHAIRRGLLQNA